MSQVLGCTSWPLAYILKVTNFEMLISWKRWVAKNAQLRLYIGWYLPSNGTIVNVELCDLDLRFQGHKFETLFSRKRCKHASYDSCRGYYLPSNGTIVNVVVHDRDLHFSRSNIYLLCICYKTNCECSRCPRSICLDSQSHRRGVAFVHFGSCH